jgi:ABC-2 type transport system permease protein
MSRLRAIRLVAMREIVERGRSRGYLLSLLFTVFLIGAGFVIPVLVAGDEQPTRLGIVGEAPAGLELALTSSADAFDVDLELRPVTDRAAAEAALTDGSLDAALAVPADLSTPGEIIVLEGVGDPLRGTVTNAIIALRAGTAILPPALVTLEPRSEADFTALLFANAGIILMFIGIFSYGTWVLTGVVEEKQSRVVEVVLSTVRPRDLLMGKVLGIGVLALAQLLALVAVGLGLAIGTGRLVLPETTAGAVVQLVLWFILGFALYSTALGFLGALASRVEDASNATMPVTMTAMAAYFASLFLVAQDPDGIVGRILTFLPPAAPMVVPLRVALDAIEPWELVGSIVVMLAGIWALFEIGARVYSGAVLQSGSRIRLRDAWRSSSR